MDAMSNTVVTPSAQASPKTLSWRDVLPVHPAAELFPRMSEEELDALGKDIKQNGQQQPIVLWSPGHPDDGMKDRPRYVLDGINRLDAMERAGIQLVKKDKDGRVSDTGLVRFVRVYERTIAWSGNHEREIPSVDPDTYVVSANILHRHLTPEQRREITAKKIEADPTKSDRQIAAMVKRDHKTVAAIRAEMEDVGRIPHVKTRSDTRGRKQPSRRPRKPEPTEATPTSSPTQEAVKPAAVNRSAEVSADQRRNEFADLKAELAESRRAPAPYESPPSVTAALAVMIEHAATCGYGRREAEALLAANPRYGSDAVNKLVGWLRDLAGDLKKIEVYQRADARAKAKTAAKGKGGAS